MFAAILKLLEDLPTLNPSARADRRLGPLFESLKRAPTPEVAETVQGQIMRIWCEASDTTTRTLMQWGMTALDENRLEVAEQAFSRVVTYDAEFAEGWNKRATVRFVMGDFEGSAADIERTLKLEPRHFGALAGLGQILMRVNELRGAVRAFEAALAINPHLASIAGAIETLRQRLRRSLH
ncbi:MAG: tetratricopeptide repeat protein [Proteobacteria bacterium]|nr:tetratricopeptide repeat protein [Pseudomonadota bacterium]MBI3495957.1 tetratricopeptide repeat protein [Pseudomonadota bacterium]